MITVYDAFETDFSHNGLGAVDPITCELSETINGQWELELQHARDDLGKCDRLRLGNIIKAPVPAGFTPRVDQAGSVVDIYTPTVRLNLRSGAGMGYKVLKVYSPGAEIVMIDNTGRDWAEVATPDGKRGYMWKSYLRFVRSEGSDAIEKAEAALREQPFRIYRIEPEIDTVTVYARHIFFDLADDYIRDYKVESDTRGAIVAQKLLSEAEMGGEPFVMYSDLETVGTADFSGKSPSAAILGDEGLCKVWKAEIARDWWDVYAVERVGRDTDVVIRQGKNLIALGGHEDRSNVVTRVVPVGSDKDGNALYLPEVYIESEHAGDYPTKKYAKLDVRGAKVGAKDESGHTMTLNDVYAKLREAAQKELDGGCDGADFALEVDFVNLAACADYADYADLYNLSIGDGVRVISERAGIDESMRVTEYTYDCLARRYTSMTLGTTLDNLATVGVSAAQISSGTISGVKLIRGAVSGEQLASGAVTSAKIGQAAIEYAHISTGAVETLLAESATITDAHIASATLTEAQIEQALITSAQVGALQARTAELMNVTGENAYFTYETVKHMLAQALTIERGEAGTMAIRNLMVDSAALVNATIGNLTFVGSDGKFYHLGVSDGGTVTAEELEDVTDGVETGIDLAALNGTDISLSGGSLASAYELAYASGQIDTSGMYLASAALPMLYRAAITAIAGELDLTANTSITAIVSAQNIGGKNYLKTRGVSGGTEIEDSDAASGFIWTVMYPGELVFSDGVTLSGTEDAPEKWTLSFWANTGLGTPLFAVDSAYMLSVEENAATTGTFALTDGDLTVTGGRMAYETGEDGIRCGYPFECVFDVNGVEHEIGTVLVSDDAEKISVTFDVNYGGEGVLKIRPPVSANIWDVKLERGDKATDWTAHPEEFTVGSVVRINEDEVYIGTNLFTVDIHDSENDLTIDKSGVNTGELTVEKRLVAPNVAYRYNGASAVTVGASGDFLTLKAFADSISGLELNGDVTVALIADCVGAVDIWGVGGSGAIVINGASHTLTGNLSLKSNTARVYVNGLTVVGTTHIEGVGFTYMYQCLFNGNGSSRAFELAEGAKAFINACELANATTLMYAHDTCYLVSCNSQGSSTGSTNCLQAEGATVIFTGSTRAPGAIDILQPCILMPPDLTTGLTIVDTSAPTPVVTPVTRTFACTDSGSHRNNGTSWMGEMTDSYGRTAPKERIRQGMMNWAGGSELGGCMWFALSDLSGKTIQAAELTLTRFSGYGVSGAVSVRLWTTGVTGRSGNAYSGAVDYGVIGTIANGETATFAIPAQAVSDITGGGGLMLRVNDGALMDGRGYSRNYAMFESFGDTNPPTLTVTYLA